MIITLTPTHPAAEQLARLAALVRSQRRQEPGTAPACLHLAVNIDETRHGNSTATYTLRPGRTSSEDAMHAYQYVRRAFPAVLDLLCHVAAAGKSQVTIEIGNLPTSDEITYSHHDLMRILPRILATFRGTVSPGA